MEKNERHFLQRYGGHLVLVVVALLLIVGSRSRSLGEFLNFSVSGSEEGTTVLVGEGGAEITLTPTPVDGEETDFDMASMPVLTNSSLAPEPQPLTYKAKQPEHDFVTYTVERGDSAYSIAEKFGIREESILGGNVFLSSDAGVLQTGVELVIMPIDGVLHTVREGETLETLVEKYSISVEDIIAYTPNNLEFPYRLHPDTQILVPGAVAESFFWEPSVALNFSSDGSSEALQGIYVANLGTGSFTWPLRGQITQGYWYGHQALDIGAPVGTNVVAADAGTITYAAWSPYCYGNLIVVNHGNGFETFYAHMNSFYVSPGRQVRKGQSIGTSGNSGCSSGPHLHFEIRINRGRDDPNWYLP